MLGILRHHLSLRLAAVLIVCQTAYAADKYALLVGVSKYSHSRMNDTLLQYPEAMSRFVVLPIGLGPP